MDLPPQNNRRNRMKIGEVLRKWQFMMELSQKDASAAIGITPAAYRSLINGDMPSGETLAIVLRWLMGPAMATTIVQPTLTEVADGQ
jgi:plasmid maintenance system antidote protein VapI